MKITDNDIIRLTNGDIYFIQNSAAKFYAVRKLKANLTIDKRYRTEYILDDNFADGEIIKSNIDINSIE